VSRLRGFGTTGFCGSCVCGGVYFVGVVEGVHVRDYRGLALCAVDRVG
jgi:hypothetical protein